MQSRFLSLAFKPRVLGIVLSSRANLIQSASHYINRDRSRGAVRTMASSTTLDSLFPTPTLLPSAISPRGFPGADDASTRALLVSLKDNHQRWHIFFNDKGFHNHIPHHLLAIWALGASNTLIDAAYKHDIPMQRPAIEPTVPVTETNFVDHLGDEKFYSAYLDFFKNQVAEKGTPRVLEEWVFSREANISSGEKQPKMLARLLDALVHSMIHLGYGLEFGLPGMVIEGLAEAAVHKGRDAALLPPTLFEPTPVIETLSPKLEVEFSKLALDKPTHSKEGAPKKQTHAFDIMARILKDKKFDTTFDNEQFYSDTLKQHSTTLVEYANQWTLDLDDPEEVHRKIAELQWMNSVVYAVSGFEEQDKKFFADFFLMHLVTSSLFLPSYVAYLTLPSQKILLRAYFTESLAWWVSRRPRSFKLDITKFMAADTARINLPSLTLNPPQWSLAAGKSGANPWFPVLQEAILHPDDHLCKIQRAFLHFASLYGTTSPPGSFAGTELEGAELLDGTLFVRAAGLTARRADTSLDGDEIFWDR